jgi:hypothetical protein
LQNVGGASFNDILQERLKTGPTFDLGFGETTLGDIGSATDDKIKSGKGKAGEILSAFKGRLMALLSGLPSGPKEDNSNATVGGMNYRPEATAFEKMGFVFSGGTGSALDYGKQTATNTKNTVAMLGEIRDKIGNNHDFSND